MDVVFKRENGSCPYFTYKNIRFFIKDYPHGNDYVYYLAERDLTEEIITFNTHKEALGYVINSMDKWPEYKDETEEKYMYTDNKKDYIINKNMLTIRNRAIRITADYDKYLECLEYAKKYVSHYIERHEPEQLRL
ncbi:MAG: hypothetical protein M0Q88_03050 [Bacilli bacterium]|nr:hypothetical protein [Bacilli bacterium]